MMVTKAANLGSIRQEQKNDVCQLGPAFGCGRSKYNKCWSDHTPTVPERKQAQKLHTPYTTFNYKGKFWLKEGSVQFNPLVMPKSDPEWAS